MCWIPVKQGVLMKQKTNRIRIIITYLTAYLITFSTIIRSQSGFQGKPFLSPVTIPITIFVILFVFEPLLSRQSHRLTHIYLGFQTIVVSYLILIPPYADYFAVLFVAIIMQAIYVLPEKIGIRWVIAITVIMTGLILYGHGFAAGIGYIINYILSNLIISGLLIFSDRAETARNESQRLLLELQAAHEKLQEYAIQAEELTAEQERNRLARNLHDSVSQTLFTMTLTAETAKILIERDKTQTIEQLEKLLELSRSALAEMRTLIFGLRPTAVAELGLLPALEQHLSHLEEHNNLKVELQLQGKPELEDVEAQRLYLITREALNNIVKYAEVSEALIALNFGEEKVVLAVEDQGKGFDLSSIDLTKNKMGLSSMRERVEQFGGTLNIDSQIGIGTKITVEIPVIKESADDN